MYQKKLRVIALMLVVAALFAYSAAGAYIPPDSPDASSYISSYSRSISNGGNGILKVNFTVTATGTMTKLGATCIRIYKSNGTLVAAMWYTDVGRANMLGSNKIVHADTESITVTPGSYYAKVTFYAKNSSGSDTITTTTATKVIT